MAAGFTEEFVTVGGCKVHLLKGGSGEPLLWLHGGAGSEGWLRYAQGLAEHYTVYMPSHPGYDRSERPDWIESMFDMACFYTWFIEQQGLEGVRAVGFSTGGFLAAEIAAACGHAFSKLMLVDALGVKPETGEIVDVFIISPAQVLELLYHDPKQAPEYDDLYPQDPTPEKSATDERNREMSVRLLWKPYAHDPRLPQLLSRVKIPARIVWGREDRLVPLECGRLYQKAIPGSDLVIVDNCGHQPHIEQPEEFIKLTLDFMA